ncbi:glycerophosphodiester phosphodiesterase [Streptomyces corynorhini]|uniref:Glycerophosphodiester phosphodiesterase n=1 Tax=Streptomyces corynorhini TaxID=2282652 RepID=A0A370BBL0_9ACTN|nr:glycerophosphodiester phosphodiesterase family protein [Streptomyces corynorhini]RDG39180.1 glycerophosphodiester phosphodiesterase [Streptomyces corynorhini]
MKTRSSAALTAVLLGVALLVAPGTSTAAGSAEGAAARSGQPLVIAHRGASAYAPENTLAAVDKAHELGIDWVENDVQRTRDGELVVIHDTTLARTTDAARVFPDRAPWKVADFTAAEIARLDAGGWFGSRWAGERVPTLSRYLRTVEANGQKLLLEVKSPELYPGVEGDLLRVLRAEGWLDRSHVARRLVVQSFSAESVRTVHERRPEITTGFLGTPEVADLPGYAEFTDQINPSHTSLTAGLVAAAHRLKGPRGKPLTVHTWTVDDAAGAVRVRDLGVDGIITNRPDVVREALG